MTKNTPSSPQSPDSWDGERCHICGAAYDTVWWADKDVWEAVTGGYDGGGGLYCIPCFENMARERGIAIQWACQKLV